MKFLTPSEYQPRAIKIFEQLKLKLGALLPSARIEHVGSSALKDAISKGDLDIFIEVAKTEFMNSLKILGAQGFKKKEDTLRTESLCMLQVSDYDFDVAIQLVQSGSEFEYFIGFRNRMNAAPNLIVEYNKLKEQSVGLNPDQYRLKKSEFISKVLNRS